MDKLLAARLIADAMGWTFVALSCCADTAGVNFRFVEVATGARFTVRSLAEPLAEASW